MSFADDLERLFQGETLFDRVQDLEDSVQSTDSQQVNVRVLSDLVDDLGDMYSGRFISGNAEPDAPDFSGMFMAGDLQDIADGNTARFGEVLNGVAQFWVANGAAWAGGGDVKIDANGITITGDSTNRITWKGTGGNLVIGDFFGTVITGVSGLAMEGFGINGRDGYVALIAYETTGTASNYVNIAMNTSVGATFDFTASSTKTASARALLVKNEISTSALNTLLYLDTYKNAAPSAGLGSAISFRAENSTPAITDLGYIGFRFNTVTAGSEDTEMVVAIEAGGASKELLTLNQQGLNILNNANLRGAAFTLANDAATSFTPMRVAGQVIIGTSGGGNGGQIYYHVGTPACNILVAGANIAVTTGALTGTTGAAGKLTVSAHVTDGKIYIENRLGTTKVVWINLL